LGMGDGSFTSGGSYPAGSNAVSAVFGDFDGDGNQDFAVGDVNTGTKDVFYGNGAGGVRASTGFHGMVVGLSVADFNGDGRTDVAAGDGTSSDAAIFFGAPSVPGVSCPPQTLPAIIGSAYSLNCAASGGQQPYTFTISSGSLPPGLSLDNAAGTISGTPNTPGTYVFGLQALDSQVPPQSGSLAVTIIETTQLSLVTSPLPDGNIAIPYSLLLVAGGTTPYTCAITSGALPGGVNLNPSA